MSAQTRGKRHPPALPPPTHPLPPSRQWFYYYLTDEGVAYLRTYLHLQEETVPATYKRPARAPGAPADRDARGPREGGAGYGRGRFGDDKKGGAPGEFKPRFGGGEGEGGYRRAEGGFGRGAAPAQ